VLGWAAQDGVVAEQIVHGAADLDPAAVQEDHVIADAFQVADDMRGQDDADLPVGGHGYGGLHEGLCVPALSGMLRSPLRRVRRIRSDPLQRLPRCSPEQDLADHRPVEINDETPGPPLGRPGHLALKLVTRPGAAEVGVHLRRRQQLDERRTVPGLGLTSTSLSVRIGSGGQATGPSSVMSAS